MRRNRECLEQNRPQQKWEFINVVTTDGGAGRTVSMRSEDYCQQRVATHEGSGRADLIQANPAMSEEGRSVDPSGVGKELMKEVRG